jgi:hypothetical protein
LRRGAWRHGRFDRIQKRQLLFAQHPHLTLGVGDAGHGRDLPRDTFVKRYRRAFAYKPDSVGQDHAKLVRRLRSCGKRGQKSRGDNRPRAQPIPSAPKAEG